MQIRYVYIKIHIVKASPFPMNHHVNEQPHGEKVLNNFLKNCINRKEKKEQIEEVKYFGKKKLIIRFFKRVVKSINIDSKEQFQQLVQCVQTNKTDTSLLLY